MSASRPIRAIAAALAALWLAVPTLAAIHGSLETHVFCLDHQAFEHPQAPASDGIALETESSAVTSALDTRADHEPCSFGEALLRSAVTVDAPEDVGVAVIAGTPAPRLDTPDLRGLATLRIAPKTSPPLLAV